MHFGMWEQYTDEEQGEMSRSNIKRKGETGIYKIRELGVDHGNGHSKDYIYSEITNTYMYRRPNELSNWELNS